MIWIYLLIVNTGSLVLMGFDKVCAKMDYERVPEIWFFLISPVGGFGGVILGMLTFHHKTSKPRFQIKIVAAAIMGISILFFLIRGRRLTIGTV